MASINTNLVGFYPEVTPCAPPASWTNDGTFIEHLKCDTAGIKQVIMTDPTLETRVSSVGKRLKIKGLRNCEAAIDIKMHGTGEVTGDGVQVAETYLSTILEHCMGGIVRGYATTLTGGTAVIPEVDDATGIVPGMMLFFIDTTAPANINAGKPIPRRVLSVDGLEVTLSEALPFTPLNGDIVAGTISIHPDEEFLLDAVANDGTFAWFIQKTKPGSGGTKLLWVIEGSVASFSLQNLSRGQLPSIALSIMGANFRHGGVDGLTNVTPPTIEGKPQLSMGRDAQCSIQNYGTTAINLVELNQCSFDVGFTRERQETTVENIDRFEGTASYTLKPGSTKFTCTLFHYDDAWYQKLEQGQEFRINFYQPGPGNGAGSAWCLHVPRAQLINTPGRADVNESHAVTLEFEAMEPDDCTGGSNVELEKSVFLLAMA